MASKNIFGTGSIPSSCSGDQSVNCDTALSLSRHSNQIAIRKLESLQSIEKSVFQFRRMRLEEVVASSQRVQIEKICRQERDHINFLVETERANRRQR